jgi:tyrosyl-tRNA synthetase
MASEEIDEIEKADLSSGKRPRAQSVLAEAVTKLVHGEQGFSAAVRISNSLFSGELLDLTQADFDQLCLDGLPATDVAGTSLSLVGALVSTGLAMSNRAAREFIAAGAVYVNGRKVENLDASVGIEDSLYGRYIVLKRGKKLFHLIRMK